MRKLAGLLALAGTAFASFAAVDVTTDTTLYTDTDWSDQGQVTVAAGTTLNLNGHTLKVAGLNCAGTITSTAKMFRYYRFKVEATGGACLQISEIKLYNGLNEITGQRSGLSWGSECTAFMNFRPDKAFDGNLGTKWFDNRLTGSQKDDIYVVVEFAEAVRVSSYAWYTGDDTTQYSDRSPTSWRFQGSDDKTTWNDLEVVTDFTAPKANKTLAYTGELNAELKLEFDVTRGGTFALTGACTIPPTVLEGALAADLDLRSWGTDIYFPGQFTLNGHRFSTTHLTGVTNVVSASAEVGELYLDVPANGSMTNTVIALDDSVCLIKAGAGAYVETVPQPKLTLEAGTLVLDAEARTNTGALTLAGGTLAVTEGQFLAVTNGVTVTAPTTIALTRTGLLGKKPLIAGIGDTALPLDQLTLTVAPSVTVETKLEQADGVLLAVIGGANDVAKAVWSGATDGDIAKAGNWICTNVEGASVADGVPGTYTRVEITGNTTLQVPASASLTAGEVVVTNCTLTVDCDWRGLGTFAVEGTLDLAGHRLDTTGYAGTGTIRSGADAGYRYYRFKVDATGGSQLQVSELIMYVSNQFGSEYAVKTNSWCESTYPANFKPKYTPDKILDNNTGTKWFDNRLGGVAQEDVWITVDYEKPVALGEYRWCTGDDSSQYPERSPVAWRLQGSNDNASWTDLDVVTGFTATKANKAIAYSKLLVSHTGGDGSELHVDVPANATTTLASAKLAGQVKLVKDGAGALVVATHGQMFCGGTEVAAGYFKPGLAGDDTILGAPGSTVTVREGAQFLDDIFAWASSSYINWVIAGTGPDGTGAIRATYSHAGKNNAEVAWGMGLTLAGDATIAADAYAFDFIAPDYLTFTLALNGHTLTLESSVEPEVRLGGYPYFLFGNVVCADTGTLVVGKNLMLYPYQGNASSLPNVTLDITNRARFTSKNESAGRNVTVSNLIYRSESAMSESLHTTFVFDRYTPASTTSAPKVQLGDATHLAPTLDLSAKTEAYDIAFGGGLTFATGAKVNVDFGSRRLANMEKVLAWTEAPEDVTFACVNREGALLLKSDGLYYTSGLIIIIR